MLKQEALPRILLSQNHIWRKKSFS